MSLNNVFYFFKGRVAFYALLKAIGIKEGDEVIIQAFTCLAVPNPIICLGAKPIYIDIDPTSHNMDPLKIEAKITTNTKVVVVQHTYGVPAEMDRILEIAQKYNLYVIEDASHVMGCKYQGKEVGSFGDASFFSYGWAKPVTIGIGGCAVINNPELKEKIEPIYSAFVQPSLVESFMIKLQYFCYSTFFAPSRFWHIQSAYRSLSKLGIIGGSFNREELEFKLSAEYKKQMPNWHQKFLVRKLEEVEHLINHRKWVVSRYKKLLPEIGIEPVKLPESLKCQRLFRP